MKNKSKKTLNRIGKIGIANLKARKIIAEISEEKNITSCEIKLPGCMRTFGLAPSHRHEREWYRKDLELLHDYTQWIGACQHCHKIIDEDKELREKIFKKIRG